MQAKGIQDNFQILNPTSIGGLKSAEFMKINPLGKMPVLVTPEGDNIPESDTLSRYVLEKFGTAFGTFGTDRRAALSELKKQWSIIESEIDTFESRHPELSNKLQTYLCNSEISLADATLFPTAVFCMYMLPQFFGWNETDIFGPRLLKWYYFMTTVPCAAEVKAEIEEPLNGWKANGRFNPIIAEMAGASSA